MKCPICGTDMVWMGNVTILIKDLDKYFYKLTKKAFQSKDIEIWGVNWDIGEVFCPNYLNYGNHKVLRDKYTMDELKRMYEEKRGKDE